MKRKLISGVLLAGIVTCVQAQTYTQTEHILYHDNTEKWVLGQVAERRVNGIAVTAGTFDPVYALPLTVSSFGKLQQAFVYDTVSALDTGQRGTVRAVKDGADNVTTLTNWKAGVPQSIQHADNRTKSAVVNNDGTIASVTDESGHKTCYEYDQMGRLSKLTYPSESAVGVCDTSRWTATIQSFVFVANDEYGIPAGHWRQTIINGSGYKQTYFDALWRPFLIREFDNSAVTATSRFTRRSYDAAGRQVFVSYPGSTDALTTGIRTTYDALDRALRVEQDSELGVLVTRTEFLPGFKTRVTNPRGMATTTQYQAWDVPTYDLPVRIDAPEATATTIVRDAWGKPLEVTRGAGP